jgi:hypothetical protein
MSNHGQWEPPTVSVIWKPGLKAFRLALAVGEAREG